MEYAQLVHKLSERIVHAQRPIRILDTLKWDKYIEEDFLRHKGKKMPAIDAAYYQSNPLRFAANQKKEEFLDIQRDIRRQLGPSNNVGSIMDRMCQEYILVIQMLEARGTPHFTNYSQQLYGSVEDGFYHGAPTLKDLAEVVSSALNFMKESESHNLAEKKYTSGQTVKILNRRLAHYFGKAQVKVTLSDGIIADAAAGAENLKIRQDAEFTERDINVLEVHEGWVHLGTTLNGLSQPICTFLSKGPPSSTTTQEGLAIITEIFAFASHPGRLQRLIDRIHAISMAEQGADFLQVFNFFKEQAFNDQESYVRTVRVFRGSLPTGGPFTKDLVYNKGFILIYNYIRLAIQKGALSHIPLLFLGKTTVDDLKVLHELVEEGLVLPPKYIPPQFKDLAALSSWMCYSLFLNQLDLKKLAIEYKGIL